jgi:dienelactone hydrolase
MSDPHDTPEAASTPTPAGPFQQHRVKRRPVEVAGRSVDVLSHGTGPRVVVLHELTGVGTGLLRFADELLARGFEVHVPVFYGPLDGVSGLRGFVLARWCLRRELALFTTGRTSPLVGWLRGLVAELVDATHPQVGVVGMCMTGSLVLATLADATTATVVAAQPALPLVTPLSPARVRRDLGLHPGDVAAASASDTPLLCVRYREDRLCPDERIEAVRSAFATGAPPAGSPSPPPAPDAPGVTVEHHGRLTLLEVEGDLHASLTAHRSDPAVAYVLDHLTSHLQPDPPTGDPLS